MSGPQASQSPSAPSPSTSRSLWVVLGILACLGVGLALLVRGPNAGRNRGEEVLEPGATISIGGVERQATDVRVSSSKAATDAVVTYEADPGKVPAIKKDANPMVRSVVEAMDSNRFPERLSPMHLPQEFDVEEYRTNPQGYLNRVEPGRVFQTAQPGDGVAVIQAQSPRFTTIRQGETISLRIKAPPGAPVTFTSFDLGAFQNELTSVTVRADEQGVAVARFTGTTGTYNNVRILAGSPLMSGQARFVVRVNVGS